MEPASTTEASPADVPPGWDYNPSTWKQRLPIVGLALVAFAAATHLALYQLDVISEPLRGRLGVAADLTPER